MGVLIACALGVAVWRGAHPLTIGVVALGIVSPVGFLVAAFGWAGWSWRQRRVAQPGPSDEADFLHSLAAELRAGATLRLALAGAAERAPGLSLQRAVRRAVAGSPVSEVGEAVAGALPANGVLTAAAFRMADMSGAAVADVFGDLAVRAASVGELQRERRSATAQARLSALVVGVAPLVVGGLVMTGRGGIDYHDPRLVMILLVGLGFQVAGALVIWAMLRRSV